MECEYCGGSVEWQGPLSNLTHTKCLNCGGINCQVAENAPLDDEEEIDNSVQQANTAICPLGEVKENCPGYGAVGERACLSCNENAAKQQACAKPLGEKLQQPKLPADIKKKFQRFVDEQASLPQEFADLVNEHFWDLI
jgi:hypothetical protein